MSDEGWGRRDEGYGVGVRGERGEEREDGPPDC